MSMNYLQYLIALLNQAHLYYPSFTTLRESIGLLLNDDSILRLNPEPAHHLMFVKHVTALPLGIEKRNFHDLYIFNLDTFIAKVLSCF